MRGRRLGSADVAGRVGPGAILRAAAGDAIDAFFGHRPWLGVILPGLVNVYITMENHHFSWENSL